MAMKVSLQGAMEIVAHEAIVLTTYKDSKAVPTLGVGHTKSAGGIDPAKFTGKLKVQEAFDMFRADLAKFEKRVNAAFKVPLKQHEFDAAVSFDFNTGAIHNATWVKLFNQGDRAGAIKAIMNWSKPKEIIPRRQKEQKLFSTGLYSADGTALVYDKFPGGARRVKLALELGKIPTQTPVEPPQEAPAPSPAPTPVPAPEQAPAARAAGFWAVLIALIARIFGRKPT